MKSRGVLWLIRLACLLTRGVGDVALPLRGFNVLHHSAQMFVHTLRELGFCGCWVWTQKFWLHAASTAGSPHWERRSLPPSGEESQLIDVQGGDGGAAAESILISQTVPRPDISKLPLPDTLSLNWKAAIFFIETAEWEMWNSPSYYKTSELSVWCFEQVLNYNSFKGER